MAATSILINVGAKTAEAVRELSKVNTALGDQMTASEKAGAAIKKAAAPAAVAFAAVSAGAVGAALAAEELASANARLSQVFESMGYEENAQAALDYARALEQTIGVDEKVIKGAQAKLATFSDVAANTDLMARATMLAADMAAAGFGDMAGNANGLGKALQDPIAGMSLLAKNGSLTRAEQKAIGDEFLRTGDKAAAQAAILEALEKQVGGVAESTADSSEKMRLAWGGVAEELGTALLPYMDDLAVIMQKVTDFITDNSKAVRIGIGVVAGFSGAILAANAAMKVWGILKATADIVKFTVQMVIATARTVAYYAIIGAVRLAILAWTAAQWLLNVALNANPIGLIVLAIAALVGIIILAYKNSETFRKIVDAIWKVLKTGLLVYIRLVSAAFSTFVGWIKSAWDWITKLISKVGDLLSKLNPLKSLGGLIGKVLGVNAIPVTASMVASRSVYAGPPRNSGGGSTVINLYGGARAEDARLVKRVLEGYDVAQGRYPGEPLAVAW